MALPSFILNAENIIWTIFTLSVTALCILVGASFVSMNYGRKGRLLLKRFPSAPKVPIMGTGPFLFGPPSSFPVTLHKWFEQYGRNLILWVGSKPFLLVAESNSLVQTVLSSSKYIEKGETYQRMHWLFGNGLVTSNGNIWRHDRKLLNPNFKYQKFDGFLDCFNKCSSLLLTTLKKHEGQHFHIHPIVARSTMDAISVLGNATTFQADEDNQLIEATTFALELIRVRLRKPWLTIPILWKLSGYSKKEQTCTSLITKFITPVVEERREFLSRSEPSDTAASTMLLADSLLPVMSNEDIKSHVITIFGAGFETTANSITYTLYLLALHPEWQKQVQEEIADVLGSEENVTFAHLNELRVLEMCVKESMRVYPPVPIISRQILEDIKLEDGTLIPAGVNVAFVIREIHRDPRVYPQPDKFDPNRFLPEAVAGRGPYDYIPFSSGSRNCIGLRYAMIQIKTVLAHILRQFSVSTKQNPDDIKFLYGVIMEPELPLEVLLTSRH